MLNTYFVGHIGGEGGDEKKKRARNYKSKSVKDIRVIT